MEYFGTDFNNHGHYRWFIGNEKFEKMFLKFDDLPFHPEFLTNRLPFGEYAFYQTEKYTVIAISGSCYDTRPGSKSVFWVNKFISKSEMIDLIKSNIIGLTIINRLIK